MPTGYRAFTLYFGDGEPFLGPNTAAGSKGFSLDYPHGEALCTVSSSTHRAPQPECTCGYFAFNDPDGAAEYAKSKARASGLMADVYGHGRCEIHEFGFRARRLDVMAFYWPFCVDCHKPADLAALEPKDFGAWLQPVKFLCEACAVGEPIAFKAAALMQKLSEKFEAGIYPAAATLERLEAFPEFYKRRAAAVREHEAREREIAEQKRRRALLLKGTADRQIGLGV